MGVDVLVEVSVGIAAAVRVDAALAVWTIKVLIAFGSVVGAVAGAANVGTHAMMSASAVNQIRYFVLGIAITPFAHTSQKMPIFEGRPFTLFATSLYLST